jgi:hypothetical protein
MTWLMNFTPWRKSQWYPSNKELGGPQSRSAHFREEKNVLLLPRIGSRFFGCQARILAHEEVFLITGCSISYSLPSTVEVDEVVLIKFLSYRNVAPRQRHPRDDTVKERRSWWVLQERLLVGHLRAVLQPATPSSQQVAEWHTSIPASIWKSTAQICLFLKSHEVSKLTLRH